MVVDFVLKEEVVYVPAPRCGRGKKVAYFKVPLLFTVRTTQVPAGHWKINVYALHVLTMYLSQSPNVNKTIKSGEI